MKVTDKQSKLSPISTTKKWEKIVVLSWLETPMQHNCVIQNGGTSLHTAVKTTPNFWGQTVNRNSYGLKLMVGTKILDLNFCILI